MSDHRPPTKPGRPSARAASRSATHGHQAHDGEERTDVVEQAPAAPGRQSRDAFGRAADTNGGVHELVSADISSIDAVEIGPAPSDPGFALPPRAAVFMPPPAGVANASFGDARSTANDTANDTGDVSELSTDSMKSAERPIEVRKWRLGGDEAPAPQRIRTSVVALPPTDHDATPPLLEPRTAADGLQVHRLLEDVDRLLVALGVQLSSREGPGARAQLSAARHRLAEAMALLKRS